MKLNSAKTAGVLKTFIQEDRAEARIFRSRIQNVLYTLSVASFAISAFLIEKVNARQLRHMTLLIDIGLVAVMLIFFWRIRQDLMFLRKAMKARQNILNGLDENTIQDVNIFPVVEGVEPDIRDGDLRLDLVLSVFLVLTKMTVLLIYADSFVV